MGMLLSVRGIRKSFGAVAALRHADLDMAEGEVVALLGDNGAGKSTFVRLLSGAGRPDGGTFRFGGNPVDLAKYSVRKARDMGIETVHQDRCLCEGQSLWRNMFVGRHVRTRWGFIDIAAEREATRVMLGEWLGLGGNVDESPMPTYGCCPAASGRRWRSGGPCISGRGWSSWTNPPRPSR